ncbi:MAG TPA: sigma-70 family RNA polymerase sigma factor, partial [Chitinophagaceae bacterium]|nr:sigma-70 family RNA polymerase sigma factor [Chitinophagaceae bacterium]
GCRFTHDTGLVKDCIQDLFLFLWHKRAAISQTPSVQNYLVKALRRRLQRALAKTTHSVMPGSDMIAFMTETESSLETDIIAKEQSAELARHIKKGVASLSRRQQEIIHLRFYLNADTGQIADIMQLNRQSVYNLLHDAIRQLRLISELYFKTVINTSTLFLLIATALHLS